MAEIRFLFDEHVAGAVATGLRDEGVDVLTAHEAGLRGEADERYLRFGLATARIVFTHDDDFLRLHRQGVSHGGIIYCSQRKYSLGQLIDELLTVHGGAFAEEFMNEVFYL